MHRMIMLFLVAFYYSEAVNTQNITGDHKAFLLRKCDLLYSHIFIGRSDLKSAWSAPSRRIAAESLHWDVRVH